uniref:occludin/ELL domain-containing protein 1 isoform X2 n=1 Tax=Jaculus jaculus TaxID=51337 RepID=UPI001E1B465C|nr:occludin/ELL domain-containing protein 1 isoform X2 [Jaculus jaculus]
MTGSDTVCSDLDRLSCMAPGHSPPLGPAHRVERPRSSCAAQAGVSCSISRLGSLALGQAVLRPRPQGPGRDAARSSRPAARGLQNAASAARLPARQRPQTHGPRALPHTRPPDPGPRTLAPLGHEASTRRPASHPQPGVPGTQRRKIVFADELCPQILLNPRKPLGSQMPSSPSVPDYELKYPPVSNERARSRYVAVFHDQYAEFLELRQEVEATQDKLQQLEALLMSLPLPQSQKEAHVAARVWREIEKKRMDPGFLDKQARCHYLKGKLRHLKSQIRKFDDQRDSEGCVYF